jgi:hypothetical protein
MEFGPRALGNRSILADPRRTDMKDLLNSRIKHREHFRPFCPSVLAEAVSDFFETDYPSPFMVTAYRIKAVIACADIPAVTHADGTGRLQTVDRESNPLYWKLDPPLRRLTGVPVLLNTLVQRERTHRPDPRAGPRLLPAHPYGRAGHGPLHPPEIRKSARQRAQARLRFGLAISSPEAHMKILLLNQCFYPDVVSTAQHASDLVAALAERGHEVTVIASTRAYDNPQVKFP